MKHSAHVRALVGGAFAVLLSASGAVIRAQAPPPTEHPGAVKNYAVPKTPWGDPDLQGIWPGIELVGVPLQRAASFGTRNWLTDEEFKQHTARNQPMLARSPVHQFSRSPVASVRTSKSVP